MDPVLHQNGGILSTYNNECGDRYRGVFNGEARTTSARPYEGENKVTEGRTSNDAE